MQRYALLAVCLVILVSCSKKKEKLVTYNDSVVNIMEQADRTMRSWNSSDIMKNYAENKEAAKQQIEYLQDSLRHIVPPSSDDTLRLSGISILSGYMQSFAIYDTVYAILIDSIYIREDSIRVQNLLRTNKNLIESESAAFSEMQKRFAARYELGFMQ